MSFKMICGCSTSPLCILNFIYVMVCVSSACGCAHRHQVNDDVIIVMFNAIHQQCRLELWGEEMTLNRFIKNKTPWKSPAHSDNMKVWLPTSLKDSESGTNPDSNFISTITMLVESSFPTYLLGKQSSVWWYSVQILLWFIVCQSIIWPQNKDINLSWYQYCSLNELWWEDQPKSNPG